MKRSKAEFISFTDSHFTTRRPAVRNDDYQKAQLEKFEFLCEKASETRLNLMVGAGDTFDSVRTTSFQLVESLIALIKQYDVTFLTIPGQHDMRFHSTTLENTPLGLLAAYPNVTLLDIEGSVCIEKYKFYGFGWSLLFEQEELNQFDPDLYHIAVAHRPVFRNKPTNWDHPFMVDTKEIRKAAPNFNLFITGDNHEQFIDEGNPKIVNSGNLLRSNVSQIEYTPAYVEYFWRNNELIPKIKDLPINKDVFDTGAISNEVWLQKAIKMEMGDFTEALKKDFNPSFSFRENVVSSSKGIRPHLLSDLFAD